MKPQLHLQSSLLLSGCQLVTKQLGPPTAHSVWGRERPLFQAPTSPCPSLPSALCPHLGTTWPLHRPGDLVLVHLVTVTNLQIGQLVLCQHGQTSLFCWELEKANW